MRTGTTWLGGVLGPETTNALAVWVTNGAGRLAVPRVLEPMVFDPTEVSVTPDHEITFLDTTADATERS